MTAEVEYKGDLRTKSTHIKSGETIITDAPTENKGKGEAFSPTDLVATNLATCMLTIMGIKAVNNNLNIDGTKAEVVKVMADKPRRIAEINITVTMFNEKDFSTKDKTNLERAALNCPVMHSINPDIKTNVTFNWT